MEFFIHKFLAQDENPKIFGGNRQKKMFCKKSSALQFTFLLQSFSILAQACQKIVSVSGR